MARITAPVLRDPDVSQALAQMADQMNKALEEDALRRFSVTKLPSAAKNGQLIWVEDASAGAVVCLSFDGEWLELQPVGPVS